MLNKHYSERDNDERLTNKVYKVAAVSSLLGIIKSCAPRKSLNWWNFQKWDLFGQLKVYKLGFYRKKWLYKIRIRYTADNGNNSIVEGLCGGTMLRI